MDGGDENSQAKGLVPYNPASLPHGGHVHYGCIKLLCWKPSPRYERGAAGMGGASRALRSPVQIAEA